MDHLIFSCRMLLSLWKAKFVFHLQKSEMVPKRQARGWGSELPEQGWECSSSGLRFKDGNPVTPAKVGPAAGLKPRTSQAGPSPGHLRPSADLEAQASTRPAAGSFQAKGVSGVSPQPRFARGGRGPVLRVGELGPAFWPRPQLAFLPCTPPPPPQQLTPRWGAGGGC